MRRDITPCHGSGLAPELFDEVLDLCVKIIKPTFPEVTTEWLIDNTPGIMALTELINFTLKPLMDITEVKKKKEKKQALKS